MQISTVYKEQQIVGTVLRHSDYFLEVEITSPYSNNSLSCSVPALGRGHTRYANDALAERCNKLLIDLYEFENNKKRTFAKLLTEFRASTLPNQICRLRALETNFKVLKKLLRAQFLRQVITQTEYQFELSAARDLIKISTEDLNNAVEAFLESTPFARISDELRSNLIESLNESYEA